MRESEQQCGEERMSLRRLEGKVAVVSGTGSGIGRALALLFAEHGACVVGSDLNIGAAGETLKTVTARGGRMVSLQPVDMSVEDDVARVISLAADTFGHIDILINNVGIPAFAAIGQMTYEQWSATLRQELDSVFFACTFVWPHLIARGSGAIVNIASASGKIAYQGVPAFAHCAGKGGVIGLTRQLAMEGGAHSIRANSISPGFVETGATRELMKNQEWLALQKRKLMLNGRIGRPEDVAYCALYLASDEAAWVTGADFAVDGGTTAW